MKLTVYFDGRYWVGVAEQQDEGRFRAAKFLFGAEPKDEEVLDFVRMQMLPLLERTAGLAGEEAFGESCAERRINPKRLARLVSQEMRQQGVSTFAQDAMKASLEARKRESETNRRQRKEAFEARKRMLKEQKAKDKRRGR